MQNKSSDVLSPSFISCVFMSVDLSDAVLLTRHILRFDIPLPVSTENNLRNPYKEQLRIDILAMRQQGMSYRQIARAVGLHWTRVQQIIKSVE